MRNLAACVLILSFVVLAAASVDDGRVAVDKKVGSEVLHLVKRPHRPSEGSGESSGSGSGSSSSSEESGSSSSSSSEESGEGSGEGGGSGETTNKPNPTRPTQKPTRPHPTRPTNRPTRPHPTRPTRPTRPHPTRPTRPTVRPTRPPRPTTQPPEEPETTAAPEPVTTQTPETTAAPPPETTQPPPPVTTTEASSEFVCKKEGFFPHPDPKKFYRCVYNPTNGTYRRFEFDCAPGNVFWCQKLLTCAFPFQCPSPSLLTL